MAKAYQNVAFEKRFSARDIMVYVYDCHSIYYLALLEFSIKKILKRKKAKQIRKSEIQFNVFTSGNKLNINSLATLNLQCISFW